MGPIDHAHISRPPTFDARKQRLQEYTCRSHDTPLFHLSWLVRASAVLWPNDACADPPTQLINPE